MADRYPPPTLGSVFRSVGYEVMFVGQTATLLCIAIAAVALGRRTIFGILYWPLKIIALVKICITHEDLSRTRELITLVRILTDFMMYVILSSITTEILLSYSEFAPPEKEKYGVVIHFVVNFLLALKADFLVRGFGLLIIAIYKIINNNSRQHTIPQ